MAISIHRETITPALAKGLIKSTGEAGFTNRALSPAAVNRYAGDMLRNNWCDDTAELIRISPVAVPSMDGAPPVVHDVVIDGQHRLHAIIQIGKARKFWVARGVPVEAFQYLDQGLPRTLKDLMLTKGTWGINTTELATAGRILWKHHTTGSPCEKPSGMNSESEGAILEYLEGNHHPVLLDLWTKHATNLRKISKGDGGLEGMGPASAHLYLQYLWHKQDPAVAVEVMEYLMNPSPMSGAVPPHPVWGMLVSILHAVKTQAKGSGGKVPKGRHVDYVNAVLTGCSVAWALQHNLAHTKVRTATGQQKVLNAYIYGQREGLKNPVIYDHKKVFGTV